MYYKANCIFVSKFCEMKFILLSLLSGCIFIGCQNKELPAKYLSNVTVVRETAHAPAERSAQSTPVTPDAPNDRTALPKNQVRYHIIVSSFGTTEKARAERLVSQLKAKNYPATLLFSSQRYRVSIESFPTEAEANLARDEYRAVTDRQDIWVHKVE